MMVKHEAAGEQTVTVRAVRWGAETFAGTHHAATLALGPFRSSV